MLQTINEARQLIIEKRKSFLNIFKFGLAFYSVTHII